MILLLVGDVCRREFHALRAATQACGEVVEAATATQARQLLSEGTHAFDVIVLAASYPGQFSHETVEQLRRLAPLSRVVGLLGSWCEGEMRTGHPYPGAIRVYWHQWAPRLGREAARWHDGLRSSWGLPITAGEEERVLALAEDPLPLRSGPIAVWSEEFAMQDWLRAACRRAGYTATWHRPGVSPPHEPPVAAIFDANDRPRRPYEHLRQFAVDVHPAPVIALAGFPRVEDRDEALASGASSVLSKPLLLEDLFWELDRLLCARDLPEGGPRGQTLKDKIPRIHIVEATRASFLEK